MPDETRVFILADDDRAVQRLVRIFEKIPGFAVAGFSLIGSQFNSGTADVIVAQTQDPARVSATLPGDLPAVYLLPRGKPAPGEGAVLPSDAEPPQIRAAAMAAAAGLRVQVPSRNDLHEDELAFLDPLTDREISVLNLMAEGFSNPQIAERLGISRNTAKFHVSSIISKLGVASRTEAVAVGLKRGLIIV